MKHFELTTETKINPSGVTLFRVRLTRECRWGKPGDLGGWVEEESNIQGDAWVSDNAQVYVGACVSGNAQVSGNARVYTDAHIYGDALVSGNAQVYDKAQVYGGACVSGNAQILGDAKIFGSARISGNGRVYNKAEVSGYVHISGYAKVFESVWETSPFQIQGTKHFINECKKGYLQIGCRCYTFEEWERNFESIGKFESYSKKEIMEYKLYIDLAIKLRSLES